MGVVDRFEEQTESTLELFDDSLCEGSKVNVRMGVVEELCEFGDTFGVGVGFELEALTFEESLEFFVVCDDTVMDDRELPLGIRSKVCQPTGSLVTSLFLAYLCGWQFNLEGLPWVAHRVCAIPA